MIRAYRLYTGPDGNSHVVRGSVNGAKLVDAKSVEFKETAAHSTFDWHNDPIPQYVITLSGVLEFTTVGGETFMLRPGDVLVAEDHTGSGLRSSSGPIEPPGTLDAGSFLFRRRRVKSTV